MQQAVSAQDGAPGQGTRAVSIYVFGDSTALIHRDRIYTSPRSGVTYITRAMYVPGLSASTFSDMDGMPHAEVVNGLRSERLLIDEDDGSISVYHRTRAAVWRSAALIEGRPRRRSILTFSVGGLDVPAIAREIGADVDFDLPDGLAPLPAVEGSLRRQTTEIVLRAVERCVEPLERGLQTLQRWGFDALSLHSIPPTQAVAEPHYHRFFGQYVPVPLRVKITTTANMVLRQLCARNRVEFLDAWPIVASGGLLRPEFSHDAFHYNALAATRLTEALVSALDQKSQTPQNTTGVVTTMIGAPTNARASG